LERVNLLDYIEIIFLDTSKISYELNHLIFVMLYQKEGSHIV